MIEKKYNGWKNYETWNVAMWINNDEGLFYVAKSVDTYKQFCEVLAEQFTSNNPIYIVEAISIQTPDGVAWNDSGLDIEALDRVITEAK